MVGVGVGSTVGAGVRFTMLADGSLTVAGTFFAAGVVVKAASSVCPLTLG